MGVGFESFSTQCLIGLRKHPLKVKNNLKKKEIGKDGGSMRAEVHCHTAVDQLWLAKPFVRFWDRVC